VITGISSGGKSTLARALHLSLGWPLFSLDNYWIRGGRRLYTVIRGRRVRVFDDPNLYDGEKLAIDAHRHERAIIEGFCAMAYHGISAAATVHLHIDIPWDEARSRRVSRDARPSDASWLLLGPEHSERTVGFQRNMPGCVIMDGMSDPAVLLATAIGVIENRDGAP